MAAHRYHPNERLNDPQDAILWDDCERCRQHADHPFDSLDSNNVERLANRTVYVEYHGIESYRSYNEAKAAKHMLGAFRLMRELVGIQPQQLFPKDGD